MLTTEIPKLFIFNPANCLIIPHAVYVEKYCQVKVVSWECLKLLSGLQGLGSGSNRHLMRFVLSGRAKKNETKEGRADASCRKQRPIPVIKNNSGQQWP